MNNENDSYKVFKVSYVQSDYVSEIHSLLFTKSNGWKSIKLYEQNYLFLHFF